MGERQGPDGRVAGWEGVEECEGEGSPHLHNALLAPRHHILPVTTQDHTLGMGDGGWGNSKWKKEWERPIDDGEEVRGKRRGKEDRKD